MYRVSFYYGGGTGVAMKEYPDFQSAMDFCKTLKTGDVLEIKYYPDKDTKKEDRT